MPPPDSVRRRTLLAGGASLLAGCSSLFNQSPSREVHGPPPLYEIVWTNYYEDPITLDVVVERDGEIVYWGTHEVPPANADPEENYLGRSFGIANRDWLGCGTYEVSTRLDGQSQWATIDFRDVDPARGDQIRPVELEIHVSPDEISMQPTKVDEHYSCRKDQIVTPGTRTTTRND